MGLYSNCNIGVTNPQRWRHKFSKGCKRLGDRRHEPALVRCSVRSPLVTAMGSATVAIAPAHALRAVRPTTRTPQGGPNAKRRRRNHRQRDKRDTNLQKTPIAISVINSEGLEDRHVQSMLDLADGAIPSLRVATFEARQSALTIGIRGIVPLDANQPAREQGVGVYIDGVYLGRQHGLNAALLDLERIEVLKGPQGTLFGRNTDGGALSMVTKAPTGEFGIRADAGVSNYGGHDVDVHLDLPKAGNFSFKVDGAMQYQDPTTEDPLADAVGWNYFDRTGLRGTVRWEPSDTSPRTTSTTPAPTSTPYYSQLLGTTRSACRSDPHRDAAGRANSPPAVHRDGRGRRAHGCSGHRRAAERRRRDRRPHDPPVLEAFDAVELRSISSYRTVTATNGTTRRRASIPVHLQRRVQPLQPRRPRSRPVPPGVSGGGQCRPCRLRRRRACFKETARTTPRRRARTSGAPTARTARSSTRRRRFRIPFTRPRGRAHAESYALYGQGVFNMRDDRLISPSAGASRTTTRTESCSSSTTCRHLIHSGVGRPLRPARDAGLGREQQRQSLRQVFDGLSFGRRL